MEKYKPTKTYMYPNGGLATPESVLEHFPAITTFAHVIETDASGEVLFAVENLSALRSLYNVDTNLTEAEAIFLIEELKNAPLSEPEPDATERIAAALELQNLISM